MSEPEKSETDINALPSIPMYNLMQASDLIVKHYKRGFKKIAFTPAQQKVEGSAVGFVDEETGNLLATARLRFHNALTVDPKNGEMAVRASLTDILFENTKILMSSEPISQ